MTAIASPYFWIPKMDIWEPEKEWLKHCADQFKPYQPMQFGDAAGQQAWFISADGGSPGSEDFTANGTFTVPNYSGLTLTVTMWGGGGGGGGSGFFAVAGGAGGQTLFDSSGQPFGSDLIGNGGSGGAGAIGAGGAGGAGGTASNGDTNTTGEDGNTDGGGEGGDAPNGGLGGTDGSPGADGSIEGGGGGGGGTDSGGGGGSGGYCRKAFNDTQLTEAANIAVTVGAGGAKGTGLASSGGVGARGEVNIAWA